MLRTVALALALSCLGVARALAWGDMGHEITGLIAYDHLTLAAKGKVDGLLAADAADTLTAPDFASRTTWADKYRTGHRETAVWHFVDIEIDNPNLNWACYGFPPLAPGQPASRGPAQDCVVNKIEEFAKELQAAATPRPERILALKFLMHFVGDLHQPLHASDHHDQGGNCIGLEPSGDYHSTNLHAFWDTGVIQQLGDSPVDIAIRLERDITSDKARAWSRGGPRDWALENFALARNDAYALPSEPTCETRGSVTLSATYQARARQDVVVQLEKAGVRLAYVLNGVLQ